MHFLLKYYGSTESCQTFQITRFLVWFVIEKKKGQVKKELCYNLKTIFPQDETPKTRLLLTGKFLT